MLYSLHIDHNSKQQYIYCGDHTFKKKTKYIVVVVEKNATTTKNVAEIFAFHGIYPVAVLKGLMVNLLFDTIINSSFVVY